MKTPEPPDSTDLFKNAQQGDMSARLELLQHYRERLRKMVSWRLDRQLAARVDASDVVQESFMVAVEKMSDYFRDQPLPFYPWLRQLALERILQEKRHHVFAQRRSVTREERSLEALPEESVLELAERLLAGGSTPSQRCQRKELRQQVRSLLMELPAKDREVLVLRHLEQMKPVEIAAVLGIKEAAVHTRHLRAIRRMRDLLDVVNSEEES